jgi:hypothetical protein
MHAALATLIDRLDSPVVSETAIIRWGCPVPSFGDLSTSTVATLGLNPSNREFVDDSGEELEGPHRRFHTLRSLGIASWEEADARHIGLILAACRTYFSGNPYDRWFRRLNQILSGTSASFYGKTPNACHLDLIPYATQRKWTQLTSRQRGSLLSLSADILGILIRDSPVRVLILNGSSVVQNFCDVAELRLDEKYMIGWSLSRRPKPDVSGIGYSGTLKALGGVALPHEVLVLGYNHNLQSSFGVTNSAMFAIRDWVSLMVGGRIE